MRRDRAISILRSAAIAASAVVFSGASSAAETPADGLRPVKSFASIRDERERSAALFIEAGKVLQHPRCLNCHPVQQQPTQGDDLHTHDPPVHAGLTGHGVASLPCQSCHGTSNVATLSAPIRTIPGDPHWALAPVSMAWQGKTLGEICAQVQDPRRNGGRTLAQIHEHMAVDHLVGWAWHPGEGREPAPGTQKRFGELIAAWIATGAHCPR
jgi:hypothetical protein